MYKYSVLLLLAAFAPSAFCSVAWGDIVKLKSGQIHEGTVTAEEEDRLQLKLDGSGVRIWFSKDQIVSVDRASQKEPEQRKDSSEPDANMEGLSDDVIRAKELLKKMREQPDTSGIRNKQSAPVTDVASPEVSPAAPPANSDEIQKLIDQFRSGQFYERLNACKKLASLGAKEAVPYLIYSLDDDNFTIRQESNKSLVKITGEDFGFNPSDRRNVRLWAIDKWKQWHESEKKKQSELNFKSLW